MKHQQLTLITVLLLGFGVTGLQAQTMSMRQKTGTEVDFALTNIKKMTFSSGNITISKKSGGSDTYALNGLRYLKFKDLTTSISDTEQDATGMVIFPNPVVDIFNIQLATDPKQASVEIFTITGQSVYQSQVNPQGNVCQIDLSLLASGMYLCKVSQGANTQTTKFIKQ